MQYLILLAAIGLLGYATWQGQRRMKAQLAVQSSLQAGDRVLLTSGMFATVRHLAERSLVVELAPGVEVTVLRSAVQGVTSPEDEEFEFTDEPLESTQEFGSESAEVDTISADDTPEPTHATSTEQNRGQ